MIKINYAAQIIIADNECAVLNRIGPDWTLGVEQERTGYTPISTPSVFDSMQSEKLLNADEVLLLNMVFTKIDVYRPDNTYVIAIRFDTYQNYLYVMYGDI